MDLLSNGRVTQSCVVPHKGHCLLCNVLRTPDRRRRRFASASAKAAKQETERNIPPWAGGGPLSDLVNNAINFPPLYGIMKVMAKQVLKKTAEDNGIPWTDRVKKYEGNKEVLKIYEEICDKSVVYPSYYLQPFHAYEEGNLNWEAAFEAESATYSMGLRVWKKEQLKPEEAQDRMRFSILEAIEGFRGLHGGAQVDDILDVGCSVGVSTRYLANRFPTAKVTGLDLSPYFLSMAELTERESPTQRPGGRIQYMHGLGEASGLPGNSFDLVSIQFTIHECPAATISDLAREAFRILKAGGMLAIVDNNPKSKVIQNLPPVLFTLMKSTEPWSDEYYPLDVENVLQSAGFASAVSKSTDPRHRTVLARKP